MRKQAIVILLLMVPNLGWSTRLPPILASIQPDTITFIGESHQHAESALLVKQWVETLIRRHRCVTLGLEIDSTQQPIMDRLLDGNASAADLTIPFSIDHPALRQMIDDLAMLKSPTSCFEMIALDAGVATDVDRDEFMAQRLSALSKEKPIVVLIGGLHTLKKINWTIPTGKPSVAELLSRRGFSVRSFPQRWLPETCPENTVRVSRFVSANEPEALTVLNESLISLINAQPTQSVIDVVDGLIIWGCQLKSALPIHPEQ